MRQPEVRAYSAGVTNWGWCHRHSGATVAACKRWLQPAKLSVNAIITWKGTHGPCSERRTLGDARVQLRCS